MTPPDLTGYTLTLDEDFGAGRPATGALPVSSGPRASVGGAPAGLDPGTWVDHYLPHWTTPDRSAARYHLEPGALVLRIDADQPAWREEDGPMRVSNVQTGAFCGPAGSPVGQHRHRDDLVVVTEFPTVRGWTPSAGFVEVVAGAPAEPACMLGIWLVGFEETPEQSGELCLAELFGDAIGPDRSRVRLGVKAHHDPRLTSEVVDVDLPLDASQPHTYAVEWGPSGCRFFVDGDQVHRSSQTLDYPLQLMLDLFEFPRGARTPDGYPKVGRIHRVRGYEPTSA